MATKPTVLKGKAKAEKAAWDSHCDEIHQKKLAEMKSQIDSGAPETLLVGSQREAKTKELQKGRQAEIDRENAILVAKLQGIAKGSGSIPQAAPQERSLNRRARKAELDKVNTENMRIVRQMQTVKGEYDHKKWDEDSKQREKLLERISEYPPPKAQPKKKTADEAPAAPAAPGDVEKKEEEFDEEFDEEDTKMEVDGAKDAPADKAPADAEKKGEGDDMDMEFDLEKAPAAAEPKK